MEVIIESISYSCIGVNYIKYVKFQVPCLEQKYIFILCHDRYLLSLSYKLESGLGTDSAVMDQTCSLTWQCLLIRNGNCSFEERWCFFWRQPNINKEENLIFFFALWRSSSHLKRLELELAYWVYDGELQGDPIVRRAPCLVLCSVVMILKCLPILSLNLCLETEVG